MSVTDRQPWGHYEPELERWLEKDPIVRFEGFLLEGAHVPQERLLTIKREAEKEVSEALEFARTSPHPPPEEVTKYVFRQ